MDKLLGEFSIGLFFWQTVLFLALLFVLRKFAWKPILDAVNEREDKISGSLEEAEKMKVEMAALKASNEAGKTLASFVFIKHPLSASGTDGS